MAEAQPGVRRLCVAAATWSAGMLASACELADVGRLCLTVSAPDGTEMAFAPPGIHEAGIVTRLTAVMESLTAAHISAPGPTLLVFHVGITRIEGESFGGAAAERARALLSHPAVRGATAQCGPLAIIMSDGLYTDLQAEGMTVQEWQRIPTAGAWVRCCVPLLPLFQ